MQNNGTPLQSYNDVSNSFISMRFLVITRYLIRISIITLSYLDRADN